MWRQASLLPAPKELIEAALVVGALNINSLMDAAKDAGTDASTLEIQGQQIFQGWMALDFYLDLSIESNSALPVWAPYRLVFAGNWFARDAVRVDLMKRGVDAPTPDADAWFTLRTGAWEARIASPSARIEALKCFTDESVSPEYFAMLLGSGRGQPVAAGCGQAALLLMTLTTPIALWLAVL